MRASRQHGQAILLIALLLTLLSAFLALGIDSGRMYLDRRTLQAAADAAALDAADSFLNGGDFVGAEQHAANYFALDEHIYGASTCSGLGVPSGSPVTVSCTFLGSPQYTFTEVVNQNGAFGDSFEVSATHQLTLALMQVALGTTSANIVASATANVEDQARTPALVTLSQNGCGVNPGHSLTISGASDVTIIGDLVSSGDINVTSANTSVIVGGNVFDECPAPPPGQIQLYCYPSGTAPPCISPDTPGVAQGGAGAFPDPGYPPPAIAGLANQPAFGTAVNLGPGIYSSDPGLNNNSGCYFLAAGVYDFQAGLTTNGGFISNELKPPDEAVPGSNTMRANPQFWDSSGVHCSGSITLTGVPDLLHPLVPGLIGIEVTSVRTDTVGAVSYTRESAPSMCHSLVVGAAQSVLDVISNVPGAQSYNIYASVPPHGCAGPFGYLANVPNLGVVLNNNVSTCPAVGLPTTCSLGAVSLAINSVVMPNSWTVNAGATVDTSGAPPPDPELAPLGAGLPDQDGPRATPPSGDRANENYCADASGAAVACPGAVTPGAVDLYIPNGGCLNLRGGGDVYTFSGYQFDWVSIYEPGAQYPPANTCNNDLEGHSNTTMIGVTYVPAASFTVTGNSNYLAPVSGGIVAFTATVSGTSGIAVTHSNAVSPAPPSARLSL